MKPGLGDLAAVSNGRGYRLLEPLGKGGFGTVYRGQVVGDHGFAKLVAIKVLNSNAEGIAEISRRLRDEARLLALLRHRAIVGVDDLVQIDGHWAVVMEFIDGADLQQLLALGPVPARPACEIAREVAGALRAAHEAYDPGTRHPLKIVHRDIKPANIRITGDGDVKVLDFGIARSVFCQREAVTRSIAFGSLGYMSPERFDGIDTPAADIYALGVVLLESLRGGQLGQLSVNPKLYDAKVDAALAGLPGNCAPLGPVLRQMLAYDREDRPTAAGVVKELQDVMMALPGRWLSEWARDAVGGLPQAPRAPVNAGPDSRDSLARERGERPESPEACLGHPLESTRAVLDAILAERHDPPERADAQPAPAPTRWLVDGGPPEIDLDPDDSGSKEPAKPATPAPTSVHPSAPRAAPAPAPPSKPATRRPSLPRVLVVAGVGGGAALALATAAAGGLAFFGGSDENRLDAALPSPAVETPSPQPLPLPVAIAEPSMPVVSDPDPRPTRASAAKEASPRAPTATESAVRKAPPATGSVSVVGDATRTVLIGADGTERSPGANLPEGTYDLRATFPSGVTIDRTGLVTVKDGETTTLRCSAAVESCR